MTQPVPAVTLSWNGTQLVPRPSSAYLDQPLCVCANTSSDPFCASSSCPFNCGGNGKCVNGVCRQTVVAGGQPLCGANGAYSNQFTGCDCVIDQYAGCGSTICSSNQGTCDVTYTNGSLATSCTCVSGRTGKFCQTGACGVQNCNSPAGTCVIGTPSTCQCATTAGDTSTNRVYVGANCDIDVTAQCGVATGFSSTNVICNLRGSCTATANLNLASSYSCNCTNGFTGSKCTNAPCSPSCTHGTCTPSGSTSSCICNQLYTLGDGSCSATSCNGPAHPDRDVPQGVTPAAVCVCNNVTKSYPGCTAMACPADANGVVCGLVNTQTSGGFGNVNTCSASGVCICSFSGIRNATTGLCVPRCSPDTTKTVSTDSVFVNGPPPASIFVSCTCRSGYYNYTGCYDKTCLNGGFLSGTVCVCAPGFSGARCELAQCSGVGTLNGTSSCICPAPYYGSACEFTRCLFGVSNTTSGTCSQCPLAYSGVYCDVSRCGTYGTPSSDGASCVCVDSSISGAFCTTSSCVNGGTIDPVHPFQCICPPQYTGLYCTYGTCGPAGVYSNGTCICTNPIVSNDPITGNCTVSTCGPFGVLNSTYTGCKCFGNATTLTRTDSTHSVLCIPGCPGAHPYNDTILNCQGAPIALPPSSSAIPYSSTGVAVSSTGSTLSSSTGAAGSAGSSTAAAATSVQVSSTAAAASAAPSSSSGVSPSSSSSTGGSASSSGTHSNTSTPISNVTSTDAFIPSSSVATAAAVGVVVGVAIVASVIGILSSIGGSVGASAAAGGASGMASIGASGGGGGGASSIALTAIPATAGRRRKPKSRKQQQRRRPAIVRVVLQDDEEEGESPESGHLSTHSSYHGPST